MFVTERKDETQREQVVRRVLFVEHGQALPRHGLGQITFVVDELRLDRCCLRVYDFFQERTVLVVVGRDRCDGRLFHLFDCRVVALFLVDAGKVVAEELPGIAYHVRLGQLRDTSDLLHFPLPVLVVDESVHELVGAELVVVELCVIVAFVVVDDGGQQVV